MHEFSVLVIVHGREGHLRRLLTGVDASLQRPTEVVVAYMDEPDPVPMECSVPLRTIHVSSAPGASGLPLAQARNAAAAAATTSRLVFLDVDSIPSARLFGTFLDALEEEPVLAMAEPRYLKGPLHPRQVVTEELLYAESVPHHTRKGLPQAATMARHEMFWSLGFAMAAADFDRVGGFDVQYRGYGAEDTDFAFRVRDAGIPIRFITEPVFHQHHGVHAPPLNHFSDIVANARRFHARWKVWPMEGWLKEFKRMGLISWLPTASELTVHRVPNQAEITAARSMAPY